MANRKVKHRYCRIIPFVAADALVKDKDEDGQVSILETGYPSGAIAVSPELRPTDASGFYDIATQENRFSPPVETEGILRLFWTRYQIIGLHVRTYDRS